MRSNPQKRNPRKVRKTEKRIGLLAVCLALLALFLIFGPKEPVIRALNVNPDGQIVMSHQGLVISELMSDNASALPDEGGNFPDWLEVWNSTDEPMDLEGITLSNRSDKAKFLFPKMTLEPDGRVIVFCDNTNGCQQCSGEGNQHQRLTRGEARAHNEMVNMLAVRRERAHPFA